MFLIAFSKLRKTTRNFVKSTRPSVRPSVRPPVRMKQHAYLWTDLYEILHTNIFRQSVSAKR